ncbi:MucBP domain-containing protein, partial [Streptococcus merionis]|uniref:MucBP domain-containing protein n=1 Tax=Streptococcus merionis TaxID=400065 RepID=UPI003513FF62
MDFKSKQRFSIRKYAIGAASVLLGTVVMGTAIPSQNVLAEEISSQALEADGQVAEIPETEGDTTNTKVTPDESVTNTAEKNEAQEQGVSLSEEALSAAVQSESSEPKTSDVAEHETDTAESSELKVNPNAVTAETIKLMTPEQISQLTEEAFKFFEMTPELYAQLTPEQIVALTFNKGYQMSINKAANKHGFRIADEATSEVQTDGDKVDEYEVVIDETDALPESDVKTVKAKDISEVFVPSLSPERMKSLTVEEIKALTVDEFRYFKMTKELYEQLTPEQIKALTFSRAYQQSELNSIARTGKERFRDTSGAVEEGYTTTNPKVPSNLPQDNQRYTFVVLQNKMNNYYYTLSVNVPTIPEGEEAAKPDEVYITAFDASQKQIGQTVLKLVSGLSKNDFTSHDGEPVFSVAEGSVSMRLSRDGVGSQLVKLYSDNGDALQDTRNEIQVAVPLYRKQITKYLLTDDSKTSVHETVSQSDWAYSSYTTEPLNIPGYVLDETRMPPNKDGQLGSTNSDVPLYKGDVHLVRGVVSGSAGSEYVTWYRRRTFIDDEGTAKIETYFLPKDARTETVPTVEEFFAELDKGDSGKYTVYTDKVYNYNNISEEDVKASNGAISNDREAFYLAHADTGTNDNSIAGTLKAPADVTATSGERYSLRYPLAQNTIALTGKPTFTNRWAPSSTVRYYYIAQKGSVVVDYKDTDGNELKVLEDGKYVNTVTDTDNQKVGTDYNTSDHKPNTIKTEDGKTYKLAEAGTYPVGMVDNDNHLTTSDATTGKVEEKTKTVTYIYEEVKGDVVVLYRTTDGKELTGTGSDYPNEASKTVSIGNLSNTETEEKTARNGAVVDTPATSTGTDYSTVDSRPETITDNDGKVYKRVSRVGGTENGKVVEGTTRVVYYYEAQKGGEVNERYVIEGTETELQPSKVVQPKDTQVGTDYTGDKPNEITTTDGKTYVLSTTKPVRDNQGDAPETGKVKEGTQTIVYQYVLKEEPKGNVVVNYKDEDGNVIKDPVEDTPESDVETPYDTTDNKPEEIITEDGKTYELVPDKTEGDETGEVTEGTTEVTYVYKEVKGNVVVTYVDTEGNEIKAQVTDVENGSTGSDYNTVEDNRPATIEKDGKTYKLVPAGDYTVGKVDEEGHLTTSDATTGKVAKGTKTVTYVYQEVPAPKQKGNVIVHYVNEAGETIAEDVEDTPESEVG